MKPWTCQTVARDHPESHQFPQPQRKPSLPCYNCTQPSALPTNFLSTHILYPRHFTSSLTGTAFPSMQQCVCVFVGGDISNLGQALVGIQHQEILLSKYCYLPDLGLKRLTTVGHNYSSNVISMEEQASHI